MMVWFLWIEQDISSGASRVQQVLHTWLYSLKDSNSFAPNGIYISNPGTVDGNALDNKQIFREHWDDRSGTSSSEYSFLKAVAVKIMEQFGKELFSYCNMGLGTDSSIYLIAVKRCLECYPDFRALFQCTNLYNTRKHLEKLRLRHLLSDVYNTSEECIGLPLFKQFNNGRGDVIGVHVWHLLVMGTLIGDTSIHPKNVSSIAKSFIALLLRQGPQCSTPGDKVPIMEFNPVTGMSEHIVIQSSLGKRPHFFLRPMHDNNFYQTGVLCICKVDANTGLLPEDMLHCPCLQKAAEILYCKPWEVPASFLVGNYSLLPNAPYALYKKDWEGVLVIGKKKIEMHLKDLIDESLDVKTLGYEHDWEQTLSELGFIVLPMIFRPCAAMWDDDRKGVGIILPQDEVTLVNTNFNPETMRYTVKFDGEELYDYSAVHVLQNIVPVGTEFWLRPECWRWEELKGSATLSAETAISVRLSIPVTPECDPTVLYVTVQTWTRTGQMGGALSGTTVTVQPGDLMLPKTEGFRVVAHVNIN